MKDLDEEDPVVLHDLQDRVFLAALKARRDGFTQTAQALDAIMEELGRSSTGSIVHAPHRSTT